MVIHISKRFSLYVKKKKTVGHPRAKSGSPRGKIDQNRGSSHQTGIGEKPVVKPWSPCTPPGSDRVAGEGVLSGILSLQESVGHRSPWVSSTRS